MNLILDIVAAARAATPPRRQHLLPTLPQGAAAQAGGDLIDGEHKQIGNGAGNATAYGGALRRGSPDDLADEASTAFEERFLAGGGGLPPTDVPGHDRKRRDPRFLVGIDRKRR